MAASQLMAVIQLENSRDTIGKNHGVIFFHHANYSTITGATFTNTTNDAYTLSYDSDDSSTFYVGATGRSSYFLGPVIAGY